MTEPFNPFASWLGLDPKIRSPHHFQLLGLSTRLTDPVEIQKAVEVAVEGHLARLDKVPPGKHDEDLAKLKQRIATASKTLLDPALRTNYIENLNQRVQAKQRASASRVSLAPPPAIASEKIAPTSPAKSSPPTNAPAAVVPTAIAAAVPTDPNSLMPPPIIQATISPVPGVENVSPEMKPPIPMAVPMSATPATATAIAPATPRVANANPVEQYGVEVNSDGVPIDQVRVKKKPLRRKRSKAGPILATVMLASVGVGGFLIYQNWDALANLARIDGKIPAAPGIVDEDEPTIYDPATAKSIATIPDSKENLSELDPQKFPEVDVDEVMTHPQTSASNQLSREHEKARAARIRKHIAEMRLADDAEKFGGEPETGNHTSAVVPEMEANENPKPDANVVTLDESQLARFRRHIERAQRSIYRREKSVAAKSLRLAEEVLEEVRENENDAFNPEQAPIVRMAADTKEIFELVGGFWVQVVASCQGIPGGEEIVIGEQIVALIEADQEKFMVRNAGSNITYYFHYCPPGLAMALAVKGAIPDVPTWSKQQAAFYAIDQLNGVNHQSRIEAFLAIAEEANHDCSGIRRYCEFEFGTVGVPSEKIEIASRDELDEALADFRTENEYTDPRKLETGVAGMLAEMLLHIDSPNFKQHVAFLEEARKLAVRSGEASKAEDAIVELDHFAKIDRANLLCDSLIDISKGKLTPGQRRTLIERAIPFLKSEPGAMAKTKSSLLLSKRLMKIAQSDGMTDAVRRLSQMN